MDIEVELSRIIINERSDHQIIILKERQGERSFPIGIGIMEIWAIDRRLKGIKAPRPMTHDLLGDILENMGAKLEKVVINDLRNHTFYALLHIRFNGRIVQVDSRPSDAIALGIATSTPIYVAEEVFDQVCQ